MQLVIAEQCIDTQQMKPVKTLPPTDEASGISVFVKLTGVFVDRQMSILHGNKWLEDAKTQSITRDFFFLFKKEKLSHHQTG